MANYREFSQQYAQGGFRALLIANGGASVAVLSQLNDLNDLNLTKATGDALFIWCAGILLSIFCWLVGFGSTRYVDRSIEPNANVKAELDNANQLMNWGIGLFVASSICFVAGCGVLAFEFRSLSTP